MSTIACPHCGVANPIGAAFCESCGKALPSAVPTGPRVIGKSEFATTPEGIRLQSDELHKQAKKAANALLTVAVLTTLGAVILGVIVANVKPRPGEVMLISMTDVVISGVVAAIYFGLYLWARKDPLPPAIVGLVLYITINVAQFLVLAAAMKNLPQSNDPMGTGTNNAVNPMFNGLVLKIVIIAMFVRAIQAGIQHRKLMKLQPSV